MAETNPHLPELQKRVAQAPTEPGIYRWLDSGGEILYVGKAKNLRSRLKSYVQKPDKSLGPWKLSLVGVIADLDYTVTSNELEALVLETNLIKEHKPKYNVMMKDDKNYVYVRVALQDPYPGISIPRKIEDDGAKYFGPFLSAYDTRRILDALHFIYDYREDEKALERLNRNPETGVNPSLAYQIGQSCGVSIGKITREEYLERIDAVVQFFKGHMKDAQQKAKTLMQEAAENKKFERAAKLRDAVQLIDHLQEKQIASDTSGENSDVIGIVIINEKTQAVVLHERNGKIIDEQNYTLKGQADSIEEALDQFLPQYYANVPELPDNVIIPKTFDGVGVIAAWLTERKGKKVQVLVPERGKKAQLLELARKNAEEKLKAQEAKWEAAAKNIEKALKELKDTLDLPTDAKRIEAYDISHLGGTETVGSMVVAVNGKPNNKHYRSFTIQTLKEGDIDDYKALAEVLKRRLRYLAADLKTDEAQWKEKGVILGKVKKADHEWMKKHLEEHTESYDLPAPPLEDFIVARKDKEIIAVAALRDLDGTSELTGVWVKESERGNKLGLLLCRKHLSKVKKGKVYLLACPPRVPYYERIGFRLIHSAPEPIEKLVELNKDDEEVAMMFDTSQNKTDASLGTKPDLLVIDGGKGQLSTVVKVLEEMKMEIPVIGLAKREEEVFIPGESLPVDFPPDSQGRFLLMRLRNEAHRFANRHREKRLGKKAIGSALDEVPGIGPKTRQELLDTFGNVESIKSATDEELLAVVSQAQLAALREAFAV